MARPRSRRRASGPVLRRARSETLPGLRRRRCMTDCAPRMIGTSVINGCELRLNRLAVLATLLLLRANASSAQASATVPPNDPVYGFFDRLLAAGLLDSVTVGQRPLSRAETGHILPPPTPNPKTSPTLRQRPSS